MLSVSVAQGRLFGWIVFCLFLSGCGGSSPPTDSKMGRMVYVDMATMQPLVHDVAASFPTAHPQTGKLTLRPAVYCSTCKKWYPAPALEQVNRTPGAGLCPKDKTPLTTEGPWPTDSAAPASHQK